MAVPTIGSKVLEERLVLVSEVYPGHVGHEEVGDDYPKETAYASDNEGPSAAACVSTRRSGLRTDLIPLAQVILDGGKGLGPNRGTSLTNGSGKTVECAPSR